MKLRSVFVTLYFAGRHAQSSPQDHYDSICPSQDGQVKEITQDYRVKYICDTRGSGGPVQANIESPEDCIALCENYMGCEGSTWPVEEVDDLGIDKDDDDDLAVDCNDNLAACQGDLSACKAKEDAWRKKQECLDQCPSKDGKTTRNGGITYKIHCNKRGVGFSGYQSTDHGFSDCLSACSSDTKCKAIHYLINAAAPCKMLGSIDVNGEPTHSEHSHIAVIPTKPK